MIFSKRNTDLSENVGLEPKDKIKLIAVCFWYSAFLGFPRKNRFVKYCYHKNILITIPNPGMWHDDFARDYQKSVDKTRLKADIFWQIWISVGHWPPYHPKIGHQLYSKIASWYVSKEFLFY